MWTFGAESQSIDANAASFAARHLTPHMLYTHDASLAVGARLHRKRRARSYGEAAVQVSWKGEVPRVHKLHVRLHDWEGVDSAQNAM